MDMDMKELEDLAKDTVETPKKEASDLDKVTVEETQAATSVAASSVLTEQKEEKAPAAEASQLNRQALAQT